MCQIQDRAEVDPFLNIFSMTQPRIMFCKYYDRKNEKKKHFKQTVVPKG